MSGNAAMTVSISSSATIRLRVSVSLRPCMVLVSTDVRMLEGGTGWGPPNILTSLPSPVPHVDIHRLPLRIVIQRGHPQLASQPAALDAAERRLEVHAAAGVDREIA